MRSRMMYVWVVAAIFGLMGHPANSAPQGEGKKPEAGPTRDDDKKAIVQSGRDFSAAFEKGDAKAVADFWTEDGEYEGEDGTVLRGRAAIEKAFAAHFKTRSASKMEVEVESIRFLSRDLAIEEGLTRTISGTTLPESTFYRTVHIRENGTWKIAMSREWGGAENRIADMDWLIGTWRSQDKDKEMSITFARERSGPFLVGEFSMKTAGKVVPIGTMKVGLDPNSGGFISWHFDPDGGFGRGAWLREGNSWVVDSNGRRADGVETASVNILTRHGNDEIGWRAIDRLIGGRAQPDSAPVRLTRVVAAK